MSHRSIQQYMSRERTYSTGQTQSLLQKKRKRKKLAKSKTWKGGFSKKRAFRWIENLKGRSMQKLRIMTSNCIGSDITHLGHLSCQTTSDLQHHRQWKSKLLGRIVVIVSNVPFPHNYHFPNFVIISGTALLADHHSFNQTWVCALLFGIHILFTKFSFISKYLKQKLKNKSKFLIFLKKA
jgi:hypothetical protein